MVLILTLLVLSSFWWLPSNTSIASAFGVNAWWPTNGAHLSGTQPFKAMVSGLDVSQYEMFWQVDGGTWNRMDNNSTDYPHKEASVDVSTWNWHGVGPYTVNFIATENGAVIAQQSETIYSNSTQVSSGPVTVSAAAAVPATSAPQITVQTSQPVIAAAVQIPATPTPVSTASSLYVDPNSNAAKQAVAWSSSNPSGAQAMKVLAAAPTAKWFGNWNSDVQGDARALVSAAQALGERPVMVAYNIPERDCGGFSAGGSNNPAGYTAWISALAQGIGSANATVILEPDAIAQISCLSSADQATRLSLLSSAVATLKSNPNTTVYLDAGHSGWIDASTMAGELSKAGIARADGFSLNVSNFDATSDEVNYGTQISSILGGKHFVIDTSRNGNGTNGQYCNPSGRAIGSKPTTSTGNSLIDAFLWIKTPGESDGSCNGGPSAGTWWADYAVSLVTNAH